ncbi:MAG: AAA family ATPase [Rhizobiaceae bacterium]|nr:AAA family ATPase [Rhizobiaceae bacterium]
MDDTSRAWQVFKRREKAVRGGVRLPTEEELLRGMPFFRDDLREDMREYGDRLARRLRKRHRSDLQPVVACLEELTVEQSLDSLLAFAASLDRIKDKSGLPVRAAQLRCLMYQAGFGSVDAAAAIAGEMAMLAMKDADTGSYKPRMLWRALAWSAFSRDMAEQQRYARYHSNARGLEFQHDLQSYSYLFKNAIMRAKPGDKNEPSASKQAPSGTEREQPSHPGEVPSDGRIIVLREVGNASSKGHDVAKAFEKIAGRPLPVPALPDLAGVRAILAAEFPYATSLVDQLRMGLIGRSYLHMRPTIFLGPPGCGKSRFARRLAEELRAPYELIPCGGMSDSALGGAARRWSTGEPSLPMLAVRRHECAGPVIILDEIEKVGTGRNNGNPHDVLLGLLEQETSSRWHDPYIQASCDLSHLTWLMTANDVSTMSPILRDRCRVLRFPEPGPEHLPSLAIRIMERLYVERGQSPRWATALEGFELDAAASAWGGGSIRTLERIVEQLVEARERERPLQ